jgi:hypothetical protein
MMTEFLKTKAVWIIAGVLCVGAIVFYILPVRSAARLNDELASKLKTREGELDALLKKDLPNAAWIEEAKKWVEEVNKNVAKAEDYFILQRRDCENRKFYWDEWSAEKTQIKDRYLWSTRYTKECLDLQKVISDALFGERAGAAAMPAFMPGMATPTANTGGYRLVFRNWGALLPDESEMAETQMEYWIQKDLVDMFLNRETYNIKSFLTARGFKITTCADMVRSKTPGEPTLTLLRLNQQGVLSDRVLRDILKAIVGQRTGGTLEKLLSGYKMNLPAPPGRTEPPTLWDVVQTATTDEDQLASLTALKNDADWKNLYAFAMDLRGNRLQSDLIGLFENHKENDLAQILREAKPMEVQKMLSAIDQQAEWDTKHVVDAISCVAAVLTDEDFAVVRRNHETPSLTVVQLGLLSAVGGGMGPGGFMPGVPAGEREPGMGVAATGPGGVTARANLRYKAVGNIYIPFRFSVVAQMDLQKLPFLMRRLLASDWAISIESLDILRGTGANMPFPAMGGPAGEMDIMPGEPGVDITRIEVKEKPRMVTVRMECEARSFLPLKQARMPAPAAAAGGPVPAGTPGAVAAPGTPTPAGAGPPSTTPTPK